MALWDLSGDARRLTIYAGAVTAIITAGFAAANAMNAGEPYWFASRSFVRETVSHATSKLETSQLQIRMQLLQSRIEALNSKISDRELLLNKQEGPEEYRRLIRQQVEEFREQLKLLNTQMSALRSQFAAQNR